MSSDALYIAVDLGASSGRVFLGGVDEGELLLEHVHRFTYPPRVVDGHLRWDAKRILTEVTLGLAQAGVRARELRRPVESVGVDSWGVDYGLVDAQGQLIEDPICYRDATVGGMDDVFARMPRTELFARSGTQVLPFNTVFQLRSHVVRGLPSSAARLLLIPDLVNAYLSGVQRTEFTNATTTALVSPTTRDWDQDTIDTLALPARLLAPIVDAGTSLGPLLPRLSQLTGLSCRVVAPATHDTGSAVAGTPLEPGWAFISSGTWSLIGVERLQPLISDEVARENFTNEGGAYGTVRFLKNVSGMWLFESCRRDWLATGQPSRRDELLAEAAALDCSPCLLFPDDPRFLNPASMLDAIAEQLSETGQPQPKEPAVVTRVILDSLALRYASVLDRLEHLIASPVEGLRIVGGGSLNPYLNQATANATGKRVLAGPVEAAVIGNVIVQAVSAGRFGSLAPARHHVARHADVQVFEPSPTSYWDTLRRKYADIEGVAV